MTSVPLGSSPPPEARQPCLGPISVSDAIRVIAGDNVAGPSVVTDHEDTIIMNVVSELPQGCSDPDKAYDQNGLSNVHSRPPATDVGTKALAEKVRNLEVECSINKCTGLAPEPQSRGEAET